MKLRNLLLISGISTSLFAQQRNVLQLGFFPTSPNNLSTTLALSATNTWLAYGFRLPAAKTLSKVRVYASAVSGTLGHSDLQCALYSDSSGVPGSQVESRSTVTSTPSSAAGVEFTGFTSALSAGVQYWLVLKNANASPASNYPTYRYGTTGTGQHAMTATSKSGWLKKSSTDGGSTWAGVVNSNAVGWRLEFSDATYEGMPIQNIAQSGSTQGVYASRECGVLFTSPSNARLNVIGIAFYIGQTGTPTGSLRYRLYSGGASPSLVTTTSTLSTATTALAGGWIELHFGNTYIIEPGTTVRAVISETTRSDSSSNRFDTFVYTVEDDAQSKLMTAMGSIKRTLSTDSGANFTETDTELIPFALILDNPPFAAIASSSAQERSLTWVQ